MSQPTFKFLARGALAPISGFSWPQPDANVPGAWLETGGELEPCQRGAHVCRLEDLAYWIHDELWEAEIEGESVEGFDCLVARRARLVRHIDRWQDGGALRFLEAAVEHAKQSAGASSVNAYLEDAQRCIEHRAIAAGAFIAALAVSKLAAARSSEAYKRERLWQASWIARHVIGN